MPEYAAFFYTTGEKSGLDMAERNVLDKDGKPVKVTDKEGKEKNVRARCYIGISLTSSPPHYPWDGT